MIILFFFGLIGAAIGIGLAMSHRYKNPDAFSYVQVTKADGTRKVLHPSQVEQYKKFHNLP